MRFILNKTAGSLTFCIPSEEIPDAVILLKALFEDEKRNGNDVPNFGEDFFVVLESIKEGDANVVFNLKFFGIAIRFIRTLLPRLTNEGERAKLRLLLYHADEWYSTVHTIQ